MKENFVLFAIFNTNCEFIFVHTGINEWRSFIKNKIL